MAMGLSCTEIEELLMEFLDGGLEAEPAADVRTHLAGCVRCAALRDDLRATLALLHTDRVPEPPAGSWERFGAEIRAKVRLAEEAEATGRPLDAAPSPMRRRFDLSPRSLWDRLAEWMRRPAMAPVAVATAAALLLAIGMARNQPARFMPERDLALAQDLDVLRAVDRPEDLDLVERLPALLALSRGA